jgi:hypothetical protein
VIPTARLVIGLEHRARFRVHLDADSGRGGDRVDGDVVVRRPDPAGGEQIIVLRPQRVHRRHDLLLHVETTRTSRSRMPCTFSQVAIGATFLSCVRPDRISSPITSNAAVQIRSSLMPDP